MAHSAMQRRRGGAQRKVISGENEAGLQRKQRSCEGRIQEGEKERQSQLLPLLLLWILVP